MTDYSSWKVADLKAELKKRGIPQTGLRLKQHFIDKLNEQGSDSQPDAATAPPDDDAQPEAGADVDAEQSKQKIESDAPQVHDKQPADLAEEPQQEPPTANDKEPSPTSHTEDQQIIKENREKEQTEPTEKPGDHDQDVIETQSTAEEPATVPAEAIEQTPEHATVESRAASSKAGDLQGIQTSEANTELSTPLPVEEALEDRRKRKRRSQSPIPTPEAIANKKSRAEDEQPLESLQTEKEGSIKHEDATSQTRRDEPPTPAKDARFRALVTPTIPPPTQDIVMHDVEVEPAQHLATAALYIDGLMRPLQPAALRTHLTSLAAPVDTKPDPEVVREFFLDAIKTHCFVKFSDVGTATRVRSNLHGTTWPNERNRKALRVDFIPDEKVTEWIDTEEASKGRAGPPARWEIQYQRNGDEGVTAVLAEVGMNRPTPSRPREPGFNRTPPLGPRGSFSTAHADPKPPSQPGQGFKPLDELFESTTTKPKLYYLRVPRAVADKRLDQFDELLKNGPVPRRGGDERRRITFEEDDHFVDIGPEYGPGARPYPQRGGRGGRGGRPGGNRRGRGF